MAKEYYRDDTGCYIRTDLFEPYKHLAKPNETGLRYTHTNEKKVYQLRLGNNWINIKMISKVVVNADGSKQKKMVPNPSYMPDTITHYKDLGNGFIKIPIGMSSFLHQSYQRNYANQTINHPLLQRQSYDYQTNAIRELTTRTVGLLHASTGSGKTQIIADITTRLHRNTLIIVQNLTQMAQMVDDITKILGVIPTQVSGKVVSKKKQDTWYPHITVCSIDSRDNINPKDFGLILLDECDTYLGSDDRREWIGSLSPEYMYGFTGTTQVNHMHKDIFSIYYGVKTTLSLLHHTPDYIQVHTGFQMQMESDTQFYEIKEALYTAENRNKLIVDTLVREAVGRKGLVFTEHIAHAKILQQLLEQRCIKTYLLIGEIKDSERERIREEVKAYRGECVVIGSVKIIGRGFDIPELSFAILTTAERFNSNIQQYLGRIIRDFPGKPKPKFIDMVDRLCYPLLSQAKSRVSTYKKVFPDGKVLISK